MRRREHGRVRTLGLSVNLYSGGKLCSALPVENLSLGGAFLRTMMPLKRGAAIGLQFQIPGRGQPLAVAGKVVSPVPSDPTLPRSTVGLRIAFEPMTAEQTLWLKKLLIAYAPGPALLEGDLRVPAAPAARVPPPPVFFDDASAPALHGKLPAAGAQPAALPPYARVGPLEPQVSAPAPRQGIPLPPAGVAPQPGNVVAPQPAGVAPQLRASAPATTPPAQEVSTVPDVSTLMVQVRGLLMQLADSQQRSDSLARDNEALRIANERLRSAVAALTGAQVHPT